jgi:hypothetical protein
MLEAGIAGLMILMGLGIAGVWTRDILAGTHLDISQGLFTAKEPGTGTLLWPHWLAEYTTAIILVVSAIGLLTETAWSKTLAALAAGALFYTSTNSLGWALAKPDRRVYAVPMALGFIVAATTSVYLLTS